MCIHINDKASLPAKLLKTDVVSGQTFQVYDDDLKWFQFLDQVYICQFPRS